MKAWNEKIVPGPRIDANIPDQWAGETINTRYDGLEPNGPNLWIIEHAKECTVEIDPADAETIGYDSNVPFGWCKECGEQVFSVRYLPYPQPSPIKRYPVTQPCGHSAGFTQHEPHVFLNRDGSVGDEDNPK